MDLKKRVLAKPSLLTQGVSDPDQADIIGADITYILTDDLSAGRSGLELVGGVIDKPEDRRLTIRPGGGCSSGHGLGKVARVTAAANCGRHRYTRRSDPLPDAGFPCRPQGDGMRCRRFGFQIARRATVSAGRHRAGPRGCSPPTGFRLKSTDPRRRACAGRVAGGVRGAGSGWAVETTDTAAETIKPQSKVRGFMDDALVECFGKQTGPSVPPVRGLSGGRSTDCIKCRGAKLIGPGFRCQVPAAVPASRAGNRYTAAFHPWYTTNG